MTSEFQMIADLRRKFGKTGKRIITGIGDDAAVISQNSRMETVISADLLIEDIDFKRQWATPVQIGHKALAVSLSDIAAMGAKPLWSIVSIGIPQALWDTGFVKELYQGWGILAEKYQISLIGGDISKTPDKIVIDSIVGGEVRRNCAIKRSGAKPGDVIYVTGELGGAAAGLKALLENAERNSFIDALIERQLEPLPQTGLGLTLGRAKVPSAMIDISDGLSSDLKHLCDESRVGALIYEDKLPIDKNVLALNSPDTMALALHGGEDFELLFTVPRRLRKEQRNILNKLPVTEIGVITDDEGAIKLQTADGLSVLEPQGFTHF